MIIRNIALAGAAAVALGFIGTPALAFTHHPATPAEIQATDDLNAKALADARATSANQPTASVNPQSYQNGTNTAAPTTATPSPDMTAPTPAPNSGDSATPAPAPTPAPSTSTPPANGTATPDAVEPPANSTGGSGQ